MSLLKAHLTDSVTWCLDGEKETPETFSDFLRERDDIFHRLAMVDRSHRDLLEISGPERLTFLQGLTSNQMKEVTPDRAVYTAVLTAQGRFQWDFTVIDAGESLLLDCEPGQAGKIVELLTFYRMRSKVDFADVSDQYGILTLVGSEAQGGVAERFPGCAINAAYLGTVFNLETGEKLWRDCRHADLGWHLLVKGVDYPKRWQQLAENLPCAGHLAWEAYRIQKGFPRGGVDLIPGQNLPLEGGLLDLQGVSFSKGCFVGQETTARTHHRGTLKKRLFQVIVEGEGPVEPGTLVVTPSDKEVGVLTSSINLDGCCYGLAILRLSDVAKGEPLGVSGRRATVQKPVWGNWTVDAS